MKDYEDCKKTVNDLSGLADEAQFKVNILDDHLHSKNREVEKQKLFKRRWRNGTFVVSFVGVLAFILK